jgi:hypothetical protein
MSADRATAAGQPSHLLHHLRKAQDERLIVPISGAASSGYPIAQFAVSGEFGRTPYPKQASFRRFAPPRSSKLQQPLHEVTLDVDEVSASHAIITMPPVPNWVTITDYRIRGIREKPDRYVLKGTEEWPLASSRLYTELAERNKMGMPIGSPGREHQAPQLWPTALVSAMSLAPLIYVASRKARLPNHSRLVRPVR